MNFQNEDYREDDVRGSEKKISKTGLLAAGGILAAALLIGGISLFAGCSEKNKEDGDVTDSVSGNGIGTNVMSKEMLQEELKAISEQLTKLDKEVISNQGILEKVMSEGVAGTNGMDGDDDTDDEGDILNGHIGMTEEYVTLISKELSSMKSVYEHLLNKVSNHESLFNTYLENYVAVTGGNQNAIVDLQTSLNEAKTMLSVTNQNISETLEMLNNQQNMNQNKLLEQFTNVKNDIVKTENMIQEAHKDVTDALEQMDDALKEKHSELVESMNSMQESFENAQAMELELLQENFDQLNIYLDTAFSTQTESIRTQLDDVYNQILDQFGSVDELLGKAEDTLNSFYEEYQADTNEQEEVLKDLNLAVEKTKEQLTKTKQELSDLLSQMEEADTFRQEELNKKLDSVNVAVEEMKSQLADVDENISGMLNIMNDQQKADHEEVLSTLQEVQKGLQNAIGSGFAGVSQTLENIQNSIDEHADMMETKFSDLDESMKTAAAEKTAELKGEMAEMLSVIQGDFDHVDSQLVDAKESFENFRNEYKEDIESSGVKLEQIENAITAASEQLTRAESNITDTLNELDGNAEIRYEELNSSLSQIQESIVVTQNQITEIGGSINETLGQMSDQQKAEYQELANALAEMESTIMDGMNYQFSVVGQDLAFLQERMESEFVIMQETFGEGVDVLQNQMTDIHSQIEATQSDIVELLTAIDEKRDLQYEDVMEAIEDAVDEINREMNSAHNNLQGLIRVLTADVAMNHRDTLDTLKEMEGSMSDALTDNMNQINDSFLGLTTTLEEQFKQVQANQNAAQDALDTVVEELGTDLTENQQMIMDRLAAHDNTNTAGQEYIKNSIEQHNSDMHLESAEIRGDIEDHNSGVLSALEGFVNSIEQKLDSVFTFVSNGKKKLASALLTKNVSVNEDATFQEFADAILNIPQEIVIGVEQVPGEIEYEYHYHTDKSGNMVHEEANNSSGGCFTVPAYHRHTSACNTSTSCGGSVTYKVGSTHWKCSSTPECAEHGCWWEDPNDRYPSGCWHCYCPEERYTECNTCGATNTGNPCSRTVTKQTCGKNTSTVEKYTAGCGLTDGQIIGAHIVYDRNAVSSAAASLMSLRIPVEEVYEEDTVEKYPQIELPEGAVIDRGEFESETNNETETEMENVEEQEKESEETTEPTVETELEDAIETEEVIETEENVESEDGSETEAALTETEEVMADGADDESTDIAEKVEVE